MKKLVQMTDAVEKAGFSLIAEAILMSRIYTIRRLKVMLDADLFEMSVFVT